MQFHFPYDLVYYYYFFYNGPFRANLFDQHDNMILQRIFFFFFLMNFNFIQTEKAPRRSPKQAEWTTLGRLSL